MGALSRNVNLFELYLREKDSLIKLSGFQKHHRIPEKLDDYTLQWIHSLAANEIETKIRAIGERIRKSLSLKRKDFNLELDEGMGQIQVPGFQYRIQLEVDKDSPSDLSWRESVIFNQFSILDKADFIALFDRYFDSLNIHFKEPVNVIEVIDWFEEQDFTELQLEYDLIKQDQCDIFPQSGHYRILISVDTVAIDFMGIQTISYMRDKLKQIGDDLGMILDRIE